MNKEEAIKHIESLESENIEIFDTENPQENAIIDKLVNKATGTAYQNIDDTLKEIGFETKGKTSDTIKYHFTSLNQKLDKLVDIEKTHNLTLEELETLKKDGVTDEKILVDIDRYKKDLTDATNKIGTMKVNHSKELEELNGKFESNQINSLLRDSLPKGLNHEDANYLDYKVKSTIQKIKSEYNVSIEDGKLKIVKDHEPYNAGDIFKDELKDLSNPQSKQVPGGRPKITLLNATTKTELINVVDEQLKSEGLSSTDEAYHKRKQEMYIENKLTDLPN